MNLKLIPLLLYIPFLASAQSTKTGPSSSKSPYVLPVATGVTIISVITAGDSVGSYIMSGSPDGLGAYSVSDNEFVLLMNHEFPATSGSVRAHGSTGAYISEFIIRKSDLKVMSGNDLVKNVHLWNGISFDLYNLNNPSQLAAFGRFCSADLPVKEAFYNPLTGKGSQEKIFTNSEESGVEGRVFAHQATGTSAGHSYELPSLGKGNFETAVARPFRSDKTVVAMNDDAMPGQVYIYIGTKSSAGTEIEKAGLLNGKLYGVAVTGMTLETSPLPALSTFSLIDLGQVKSINGASLNTLSNNSGITDFLRPEDGAWDPSSAADYYFTTTNSFNNPSRLWKLHFSDAAQPELGGTITAVLDGGEGHQMLDNLAIDAFGMALLNEDTGNNAYLGKVWQYNIHTDALTELAVHDPNLFLSGSPGFLTPDEETSGIIDVQHILGPGMFLFSDMAHYPLPSPVVEGGQLMAIYNPGSALYAGIKNSNQDNYLVYPNPVADQLHILTTGLLNGESELLDVCGRKMECIPLFYNEGHYIIHVGELPSGLYYLKTGRSIHKVSVSR